MTEVHLILDEFAGQAHAADRDTHRAVVQDRSHRTREAGWSPAARSAREQRASARHVALVRERARTLARETR